MRNDCIHKFVAEGQDYRGEWGYCSECGTPMFKPQGQSPQEDDEE